jgi:ADP-dependent NAD(P)H-hydrate dehydratase / NAD(P)H-hydrate epimerase
MRPLVLCPEAARLDAATAARAAMAPLLLMEDASLRLWDAIRPLAESRGAGTVRGLVAVCGSGNNGGDALALLRHARFSGATKVAAILAGGKGELAAIQAASLEALGVAVLDWNADRAGSERLLGDAALIVDGLAGTGLAGALREGPASLAEAAQAAGAPIASIDLPSGLSDAFQKAFPVVGASWTLSIEPRKACLYYPAARESCGAILPIEGIFPADAPLTARAFLLEAGDLRGLAPLPPDSAYKGERGRVAVFAGSPGASGAAVLASKACLAAGAGLAALFASSELYPVVAPMLEAVMVKTQSADGAFEARAWDALLIGPGWGREASRLETLAALLGTGLPAVLDADAIGLYRRLLDSGFLPAGPVLLTPHPGEFEALTGIGSDRSLADPASVLPKAAADLKAAIILKSQVTWIASPDGELAVWDGRESGLGTAGSGDVLAGLAAGLLAGSAARARTGKSRAADGFSAARAAVIAHGLAGKRARAERGWFEAGAIIEAAARILGQKGS